MAAFDGDEGSSLLPDTDAPVVVLGRMYSAKHDLDEILSLLRTCPWFSYRKDFPEIGDSGHTSDWGWGCMLRCGQMILANSILRHRLGPDWRWSPDCRDSEYLALMRLFEDTKSAVYGIHQIALMGESMCGEKKAVGTWFGPNMVAQVLRKLTAYDHGNPLNIHVALDNAVVIDEIKAECKREPDSWKALLLVVPLRLGLTETNPIYFHDLKECFEFPQSVGVIGGRPNHALYFVGCVEDDLLYLDPHTTQATVVIGDKSTEDQIQADATYHLEVPARLDINELDPSLALCFFCASESDFDALCELMLTRLIRGHTAPLFELCRQRPHHHDHREDVDRGERGAVANAGDASDDEFEIL